MKEKISRLNRKQKTKALRDLAFILVLCLVAYYASRIYNTDGIFSKWFLDHPQWRIDQFLTLLVLSAFALGVFALGRWQELHREIIERNRVERLSDFLAAMAQKLSAVTSSKEAALVVLDTADELFGWDACYISIYSEKEDRVISVINIDTVDGERKEFPPFHETEPSQPDNRFLRVIKEGPELILRNETSMTQTQGWISWGNTNRRSMSLMFVPIRKKGKKNVGILSIQSYTRSAYSEHDLELLEVLASHCSAAMERTYTQEKLRQSQGRLHLLMEQMPAILWTIDADMRFNLCLGRGLESIELNPDEIQGRTLYEFFETDDPSFLPIQMHSQALQGTSASFELEWKERVLQCHVEPLRDPEGNIIGCINVAHDLTDRKVLEQQLHRSQNIESLGKLAGGVAHDFNNILQAILGYTQCALKHLKPDDAPYRDLEQIRKATGSASNLTRQLLAFGRRQILRSGNVDLNHVITDLLKMLRRVIGENIDLDVALGHNLGTVHADPAQMEQVLANLFINARDAMPEGGKITITTENVLIDRAYCKSHPWAKEGRYVLLKVSDNGCGMTPEVQDRIFEPFFTTKDEGKGSGLGLAMVYGIVKQHDGLIHVYSELGQGTVFKIYLAIVACDADVIQKEKELQVPGGSETILLAEDEEMVREVAVRILEDAGYQVLAASDGEEAIRLFEANAHRIDLALFDVIMPNMSGRAVYDRIKAIQPDFPILFSSGYGAENIGNGYSLEKGMELIEKPYDPNALLLKVREMLDVREKTIV